MQNIFIIGSKGIPAKYGGFETFVDKLTKNRKSKDTQYHVSCLADNNTEFIYNDARCFNVKTPEIGSAKAIFYDIQALIRSYKYIIENKVENPIIYILACRIGPFIYFYKNKLRKAGIQLFINPDGHEWKRSKWNKVIRWYWKFSEKLMVKKSDLLICDSKGIEKYINEEYESYKPNTTFISYGADVKESILNDDDEKLVKWYSKFSITKDNYYLIVGRFVPENNYETMIREFIKSNTKKDLVIITNITPCKFYDDLKSATNFEKDNRVKFVGTVYDQELLKKIRENAYGYFHGHEVGGTNPSLLEALASTKVNLLLDVNFNNEVGGDGALYFNKEEGYLSALVNKVDNLIIEEIEQLSKKSLDRIINYYSWDKIVNDYEGLFSTIRSCEYERNYTSRGIRNETLSDN